MNRMLPCGTKRTSCMATHWSRGLALGQPHGTGCRDPRIECRLYKINRHRDEFDPRVCATSEGEHVASVDDNDDEQAMARVMKGYRVFPMDGCTFLVKQVDGDKLDLSNVIVVDEMTQETTPAMVKDAHGSLASVSPQVYQEIEWASHFAGNAFEDKEPKTWVLKVYLVALDQSHESHRLDFDRVFVLDALDRSVSSCPVARLAPPDTPDHLLQLRIRDSGITIDTVDSLPDPEQVVRSKLAGVPAKSALEESLLREQQEEAALDGTQNNNDDNEADEEEDMIEYEDGEDDNLSDFLVEVDDDSDSEFDGEGGDGDYDDDSGEY